MVCVDELKNVPVKLRPISAKNASNLATEFSNLSGANVGNTEFLEFLGVVFELSPYLKDCAFKDADFISELVTEGFEKTCDNILRITNSAGMNAAAEPELMTVLRQQKRRLALLCGLADLGGWWSGDRVTTALSAFARATLSASFDFILLQNHHSEKVELADITHPQDGCGIIALGMGKLGAGELNYSSDIDLVLFFDDETAITLNTDDPVTLLGRMAKQLVKIMQERTADGYVFRMDLRLRPDPSSTPLVIPREAALNYYEGQGQNWERAAMIKARPVAGDIKTGEQFLAELGPFIWRKYLDFAAINDVQSIKRQIHAHKGHGEIAVLGHNIKLGRGGIREIEFFAQTQQLIAGGRNPRLRENVTVQALAVLAKNGWVEQSTADQLTEAYWFLRNLEHRLQMVRDEQTHTLPDGKAALKHIALMFGETNADKFSKQIRKTLEIVEKHYAELFESADDLSAIGGNLVFTGHDDDPGTVETLEQLGFSRPHDVMKIIKSWHTARIPALQATQARELLTELMPTLLKEFGKASDPDDVMFTFDRFISGLPAGIQFFSILKNNPNLGSLLVRILSAAPVLAQEIARRPHVFDAMLEPQFGEKVPERQNLLDIINSGLARAPGYEMALDEARRFFHENRFLIGCQYFGGTLSPQNTAMAFSVLGEVMIAAMLQLVRGEFEKRHGKVPGAQVCILGMGRLGSRELTASSDLDLIFLYDFDDSITASDGDKPLAPSQYFIRLMQRFIAAMSSPTAEGKIFELDFRLRPSGNAGPLATHVGAFLKYQREDAWVWEAQALTRARAVAGDIELCDRLNMEISDILKNQSRHKNLKKEIFDMRMLVEKEKGGRDPWQSKTASGGMLDIEFIAQWIVLESGDTEFTATREILSNDKLSLLTSNEREELISAYDLYSRIMHLRRICLDRDTDVKDAPDGFAQIICSSLDLPNVDAAAAHLVAAQKTTRSIFNQLLKT